MTLFVWTEAIETNKNNVTVHVLICIVPWRGSACVASPGQGTQVMTITSETHFRKFYQFRYSFSIKFLERVQMCEHFTMYDTIQKVLQC